MEDVNFIQMHHIKWGEEVLLYNHIHKFKHILCEDLSLGAVLFCICRVENQFHIASLKISAIALTPNE